MALIKGKQLANSTISSSKIAEDAITTAKIADNAVDAAQIAAGAVTTVKIADSNITTVKIGDGEITFDKFHADAVVTQSEGLGSADNTVPTSAAVKTYVDGVAQGLDVKDSVIVATTAALETCTYSNGTSGVGATLTKNSNGAFPQIDGVTLSTVGNRILVKNQASAAQNGIYKLTTVGAASGGSAGPWVLTRDTDADTNAKLTSGSFAFVEQGTSNGDTGWACTTDAAITIGTTGLIFAQFSSSGSSSLGGLTNVNLSSPADNAVLRYVNSASEWQDAAIGDFVGLNDLSGVTIASIADNQFLRYDNASGQWKNETVSIGGSQAEYIETVGDSTSTLGIAQASGTATVKTTAEITLDGNAVSALSNGDYVEVTSSSNSGIDATDIGNAGMTFVTQATGSSVDVPQGAILEVTNASNLNNAGVNGLKIARIYTPENAVDASKVSLFFNGLRQRLGTNLDGFGFRRRNSGSTSGFANSDTTAGLVHGQDFLVYTVTNSIQLETDDSIVATYVV